MMSRSVGAAVTSTTVDPLTTVKSVGETFFVTINVANVANLWGYGYVILYNTTVLTALNFTNLADQIYSPFSIEESSLIDDVAGNVSVSYHAPMGDDTGITTVESKVLLKIAFKVDAAGSSTITIDQSTRLVDVYGDFWVAPNNMNTSNGYFSTEAITLHDIAITGVTVSATTAGVGDTISIDVAYKNNGDFIENFTVTVKHNTTSGWVGTGGDIGQPKAVTNLAPDAAGTLNFSWDTTGLAVAKYVVRANATVANEAYAIDNARDTDIITLTGGGTSGLTSTVIYIVAAIVIVIVVVVVIYVLRRR
jgi:hypothetical protein